MPGTLLRILSIVSNEIADAELLARFVSSRDADAFEELVRRHGPAVSRVCRRLVDAASADDAFQATFLILACRAASVRRGNSVGSWLIGVAGRVSRQLRKRNRRTVTNGPSLEAIPAPAKPFDDLAAVLDDELTQLPDRLRDPIVLCLVHGRTQEEAAAELGGSVRTLRRRLDRAKQVLRLRLERRGVVPALAAGLVAASQDPVAALSPDLIQITVQNVLAFLSGGANTPAATLAKGVVMGPAKWKVGGLVAAAAMVMIGLGIGLAGDPPQDKPASEPLVPDVKKDVPTPVATVPYRPVNESAYRSTNFLVSAPSPAQARMIAIEAEFQRRETAKRWLGKELPNWPERVAIAVAHDEKATGGATTFNFGNGAMQSAAIHLTGPFLMVAECELPHEVTHCVMASHFGKPLPRWVDEGIALLSEPAARQTSHIVQVREILNAGRAIKLKHLFKMVEYPRDTAVLYAEGHSVVRFLLTLTTTDVLPMPPAGPDGVIPTKLVPRNPHVKFIDFVHRGLSVGWETAANEAYGFASVDELESAWIDWLKKPESNPDGKPTKPSKDEKPELIPPTKLPAGK